MRLCLPVAGGNRVTKTNVYNHCHHIGHLISCVSRYDYVGSNHARLYVPDVKPCNTINTASGVSYTGNYILKAAKEITNA